MRISKKQILNLCTILSINNNKYELTKNCKCGKYDYYYTYNLKLNGETLLNDTTLKNIHGILTIELEKQLKTID